MRWYLWIPLGCPSPGPGLAGGFRNAVSVGNGRPTGLIMTQCILLLLKSFNVSLEVPSFASHHHNIFKNKLCLLSSNILGLIFQAPKRSVAVLKGEFCPRTRAQGSWHPLAASGPGSPDPFFNTFYHTGLVFFKRFQPSTNILRLAKSQETEPA